MLLDLEEDRPAPGNKSFRKIVGIYPGTMKTANARGEGVKKRKELDQTARKLNLRK